MNYGTLKTSVANYLHRSDLTAIIPDFIDQARTRIGGDLRTLANHVTGTASSFVVGRTALPANWGAAVAVTLGGFPLQYVTPEAVGYWSRGVYSVDGGDLVVPEAGSTSSVGLVYYAIPAALVADPDVAIGMAEWPQLWIYASVAEGALYIQEYELARFMNDAYMALLATANRSGYDQLLGPGAQIMNDQPQLASMATL